MKDNLQQMLKTGFLNQNFGQRLSKEDGKYFWASGVP
jgi:hypothetical protein